MVAARIGTLSIQRTVLHWDVESSSSRSSTRPQCYLEVGAVAERTSKTAQEVPARLCRTGEFETSSPLDSRVSRLATHRLHNPTVGKVCMGVLKSSGCTIVAEQEKHLMQGFTLQAMHTPFQVYEVPSVIPPGLSELC